MTLKSLLVQQEQADGKQWEEYSILNEKKTKKTKKSRKTRKADFPIYAMLFQNDSMFNLYKIKQNVT